MDQKRTFLSNRSVDIRVIGRIELKTIQKNGRYNTKIDTGWTMSVLYRIYVQKRPKSVNLLILSKMDPKFDITLKRVFLRLYLSIHLSNCIDFTVLKAIISIICIKGR